MIVITLVNPGKAVPWALEPPPVEDCIWVCPCLIVDEITNENIGTAMPGKTSKCVAMQATQHGGKRMWN